MSAQGNTIHYRTDWLVAESTDRSHVTRVLDLVRRERGVEGKRVVELGSGIGTNLARFVSGNKVLGVEGMPAAVAESKRRGIEAIEANLEHDCPLPSESADLVLCIDVLEHLMNPAACVATARRILKRDGLFVVNVPNHFDWRGRMRVARGSGIDSQGYFPESPHWEYPHVRFFDRASIAALLKQGGFRVVEDLSHHFLSFPKAHWFRALGLSGWLARIRTRWPDAYTSGYFLVCARHA